MQGKNMYHAVKGTIRLDFNQLEGGTRYTVYIGPGLDINH